MWREEKKRTARRAPGDNVLPDQFQTVAAVLASDWCQKTCVHCILYIRYFIMPFSMLSQLIVEYTI